MTHSHHVLNTPGARHCARHCKSTRSALRGVYYHLHFTSRKHTPRIKWLAGGHLALRGRAGTTTQVFSDFFLKTLLILLGREGALTLIYFSMVLISLLICIFLYHWEVLPSLAGGPSCPDYEACLSWATNVTSLRSCPERFRTRFCVVGPCEGLPVLWPFVLRERSVG